MGQEVEINHPQGTSLILSDKAKVIAKVIVDVNDLVGFKKTAEEIISWSSDIERLAPGIEPERLAFLMDCFKTDRLLWDKERGIQNIFRGLKLVDVEDGKYILLKPIF